jgi:metal-sulfur cluster biosynthetic enzyme
MSSDPKANLVDLLMMNLQNVIDPEIGISIVELGLIYNIAVNDDFDVELTMTLTAPNCPFGDMILMETEFACRSAEGVKSIKINLTFDPPWNPDKITDEAKYTMGLL